MFTSYRVRTQKSKRSIMSPNTEGTAHQQARMTVFHTSQNSDTTYIHSNPSFTHFITILLSRWWLLLEYFAIGILLFGFLFIL